MKPSLYPVTCANAQHPDPAPRRKLRYWPQPISLRRAAAISCAMLLASAAICCGLLLVHRASSALPLAAAWVYLADAPWCSTNVSNFRYDDRIPEDWAYVNYSYVDVLIIGPLGILQDGRFGLVSGADRFNKTVGWCGADALVNLHGASFGDLQSRFEAVITRARAQNPSIDIRVSVWWTDHRCGDTEWGRGLCAAAGYDQTALARLATSAREFLARWGLQGLDVDCEAGASNPVRPERRTLDVDRPSHRLHHPHADESSNVIPNFPAFAEAVQVQLTYSQPACCARLLRLDDTSATRPRVALDAGPVPRRVQAERVGRIDAPPEQVPRQPRPGGGAHLPHSSCRLVQLCPYSAHSSACAAACRWACTRLAQPRPSHTRSSCNPMRAGQTLEWTSSSMPGSTRQASFMGCAQSPTAGMLPRSQRQSAR